MQMISPFTHSLWSWDVANPQVLQAHEDEVSDVDGGCMHNSEVVALNNSKESTNDKMNNPQHTFCPIVKYENIDILFDQGDMSLRKNWWKYLKHFT